ncbi:DinB family protein [Salibacterium aidingense]|uniref:DinB family protein n=1 Tax=Salibacterium aidingense TaxID=384933 RepID=UPI000420F8EA|nr:DinB family protein [Salibacterium aidingense]
MERSLNELLIQEFSEEAASTRQVLERVPEEKLSWAPHEKSMTLGQLTLHIAILPDRLTEYFSELTRNAPDVPLPEAESAAQILTELEQSEAAVMEKIEEWSEEELMAEWKMVEQEQTLLSGPRYYMIRSILLNHWYHHRGQLTVYLRLLDIPVPAVYGSSADEKPL